jgi:membrane-associated protein
MPYGRFAMFNVVGAVSWVGSMTLLGYFLGKVFDAKTIERVVYVIIVISVLPVVVGAVRAKLLARSAEGSATR